MRTCAKEPALTAIGRLSARAILLVVCTFILQANWPCKAQEKSGAKPTVVSLPSGPGSIEGLGKSFQPHLNSGTFTYSVPLTLPRGTAGFAPSVELTYNSGGGNSPLGYGWRLSPMLTVERQTEKGFPRYRDSDDGALRKDVFIFQGEELVPLSDGTYRCEIESEFRRLKPARSNPAGPIDSWLVEDPNGTKHWLGRYLDNSPVSGSSRMVNPSLPEDGLGARSPFETTFAWYEDAAEDVNGNRIEYGYSKDPASPGVLYLAGIRYYSKGGASNVRQVAFLYGSRADQLADYRAGFVQTIGQRLTEIAISVFYREEARRIRSYVLSYDPRDGVFGDLLSGFADDQRPLELGLTHLYAVTQYDSGHLPASSSETGSRLPPLRFSYSALYLRPPPQSFLDALQPLRFRLRPARAQIPAESDPLAFGPAQRVVVQNPDPDGNSPSSVELDVPYNDPHVQFADLNGDGLPDLVDTRRDGFLTVLRTLLGISSGPQYRVALNMGGGVFKTSTPVATSPGIDLSASSAENAVTLADMDGDGMVDLLQIRRDADARTLVYKNNFDPSLPASKEGFSQSPVELITQSANPSFSAPNVRLTDLNEDKKTDLLVTTADGITGYSFDEHSGWTDMGRQDWSQTGGSAGVQRDYSFSRTDGNLPERPNPLVQLADMNGDRLLDLVQIVVVAPNQVELRYHPLVGPARWGGEVNMEFARADGRPSGATGQFFMPGVRPDPLDPQNGWGAIQLLDVNGDGLTDIVYVEQNHLAQVFLNCAGKALAGPYEFSGMPVYEPYDPSDPTILRTLDINGNGSTDLVFFNSTGGQDRRGLRYVDFLGGQKAGLLQTIDNGLGSRTFVRYRSSTEDLIRARKSDHPWVTSAPNSTWVVCGVVTDIGLDLNGDGETDKYVSSYDYRDAYYDSFEKQFRGFSYAQKIEWGDDVDQSSGLPAGLGALGAPSAITRYRFMTGSPDGADNDEYIDALDAGSIPLVDESSEAAGREEKALKGKPVFEEVLDGAALADESASFDLCAERTARAAHSPTPFGPAASRCTPDKYVYYRTASRWAIRRLYRPQGPQVPRGRMLLEEPGIFAVSGKSVSFAVLLATRTETIEANQLLREKFSTPSAPVAVKGVVVTSKAFDYDNYGNTVLVKDEGVVAGLDPPPDDERVTKKEYILTRGSGGSIGKWMIRLLLKERVEDENGVFAGETQYFYDGPEFVGLPLGQVGERGLVSRARRRVKDPASPAAPFATQPSTAEAIQALKVPGDPSASSAEWVDVERKAYDQYGNPIVLMDPSGLVGTDGHPVASAGHFRSVTYDPVFDTYPTEERIHLGTGMEDLVISSEYERPSSSSTPGIPLGLDVVSRSIDFNGNPTDYYYDTFGRLTAVRKPGDSEALPTVIYTYGLADPHRGLLYRYAKDGSLAPSGQPVTAPVHNSASFVRTDARLTQGQASTFSRIEYTDGAGHSLLSLEESAAPGQFVVTKASRLGLRGSALYAFQPYGQTGDGFALPALSRPRNDLFYDAQGRVIRTLLPSESGSPPPVRPETRAHYLPLTVYTFDEEDLASSDPSMPHLNTPKVRYLDGLGRITGVDEVVKNKGDGTPPGSAEAWPTRYGYDLNDKLVYILDSQGNQKWMRYDGLGRMLYMNDPDRGAIRYTYDNASNRVETTDASGQRITFTYDGANRPLTEDYHDEGRPFSFGRAYDPSRPLTETNRPDVIYTYDQAVGPVTVNGINHLPANTRGRLARVDDLSGQKVFSYDERGRESWSVRLISIKGETQTSSYLSEREYDASDRVTRLTLPDGDAITYGYNARSLVDRIGLIRPGGGSNPVTVVNEINYLPSGQLSSCEYGNHVLTTYGYDSRLRLSSLVAAGSGSQSSPLLSYQYKYDGASNLIRIEDTRPQTGGDRRNTQLFTYDDLNRLTRVLYPVTTSGNGSAGGQIDYRYDRIGNLVSQRSDIDQVEDGRSVTDLGDLKYGGVSGSSRRMGRTSADAGPHALTSAAGQAVAYDADGNVTRLGATALTWDFLNRLVAVESDRMRAEYVYDYEGQRVLKRVWKKEGGVVVGTAATTWYVAQEYEVLEDGRVIKYVWRENNRIARVDGSHLTFYHQDHIRSSNAITDQEGGLVEEYGYYPFGQLRYRYMGGGASGVSPPEYMFGQKERDRETNFYDFGARYYAPIAGHFLSADALYSEVATLSSNSGEGQAPSHLISFLENPQKANLYAYALRNPLRFSDPTGADPVDHLQIALAVAGMIPGPVGMVCNVVNAGISLKRGDYIGASISLLAVVPAVGEIYAARSAARLAEGTASAVRGGAGPVRIGQAGVAKARAMIEAEGGIIKGEQITIETAMGRGRPDLLVEYPGGKLEFVEVKSGTGRLTANQSRVYPAIESQGGIPRGANATKAGLEVGKPLGPTPVRTMRVE